MERASLLYIIKNKYRNVTLIATMALLFAFISAVFKSSPVLNIASQLRPFGELLLNICYSIIAAYVFFLYQTVLPEINKIKSMYAYINKQITSLLFTFDQLTNMYGLIIHLLKTEVDKDKDISSYICTMSEIAKSSHELEIKAKELINTDDMYLPKNYATALTNVLCSPFYQMAESYYLLISEGYNEKINVMPFINSHKGNIFTEEALKKWEFLRNGLQGDLKRLDF